MTRYLCLIISKLTCFCIAPSIIYYSCDLSLLSCLQVGHEAFEQNASGGFPNDGGSGFGEGFNPFDIFGKFNEDV